MEEKPFLPETNMPNFQASENVEEFGTICSDTTNQKVISILSTGPDSEGKFPCDHCDYKATQQSALKNHKISFHDGVKYECDQCNYKATDQSELKKHQGRIHEGVTTYKATNQSNLETNKLSILDGVK